MFERFTERARQVVLQAQAEARSRGHNYIGTEHILLALVHEDIGGVAPKALESMQISADAVRDRIDEIIGRSSAPPPAGHIPFTPRSKKVLELSLREALQLGHHYIGTEHILLGILGEGEGVAVQVLTGLGTDLGRTRQQVTEILTGRRSGTEAAVAVAVSPPASPPAAGDLMDRLESMAGRLGVIERKLRDAAAGSG
jgi:ATP-dependent Clp protease ATP-binding subunit ClpC